MKTLSTIFLVMACISTARAQTLPFDPNVTVGRLPNGLTYYIMKNAKPEKRVELRLAVHAGAILEDDDQQGLAHFVEHMAFNGTKNFRKNEIINYIESIGVRFGADLNAFTSQDQTVYMLQLPTDKPDIIRKGMMIFSDWAHNVSFDSVEIEKERGVVIEEWRLGRGANARIEEKQAPIVYKNSRYAVRNVIGDKKGLETFTQASLKRFYREWYRPELMAFVVVGDIDVKEVESLIKEYFGPIPASAPNVRPRTEYTIPDNTGTLCAIATDPELSLGQVELTWKHPADTTRTEQDLRRDLVENMYAEMMGQRFREYTLKPNSPFLFAVAGNGNVNRVAGQFSLTAFVNGANSTRALETLVTEAARVRQHGFTSSELERAKQEYMRRLQRSYDERNKRESGGLAMGLAFSFLNGSVFTSPEFNLEASKRLVPGITLDEVNHIPVQFMTPNNRVIAISAAKKDAGQLPDSAHAIALVDKGLSATTSAYKDDAIKGPLLASVPMPGSIVSQTMRQESGVYEWTLSNGAKVVFKPTEFKDDEVIMQAFSPGGTSLAPDSKYYSAASATAIVTGNGLGSFNQSQLTKALTGKIASVSPFIAERSEGLSGQGSAKDAETMMKLIHLYFTEPRDGAEGLEAYKTRMKMLFDNQSARPEFVFFDTVSTTMTQNHPRTRPWNAATLDSINLNDAYAFYRDRFADASDFTFIFVGNIKVDDMKHYAEQYLATLPSTKRKEAARDLGIRPPKGVITKVVVKGTEPKSSVDLEFTGSFEYNRRNRYVVQTMLQTLNIKLREDLREDKSGVYGISARASFSKSPVQSYTIRIGFGCAPERVEELIKEVFAQIEKMKLNGPDSTDLAKVRETQLRGYEVELKDNRAWMNAINSAYQDSEPVENFMHRDELTNGVTSEELRKAAEQYFNMSNYARFVLVPVKQP